MTKQEHLAAYVECKAAVPGSADSILILFTHNQRDMIVKALRALTPPEPTEGQVELMAKAIYDLSPCLGFATCDACGDCTCRKMARAAYRALSLQDHGWQDISTAPNDRDILATVQVSPGKWHNAQIRVLEGVYWDWCWGPRPSHWREIPVPPMVAEEETK